MWGEGGAGEGEENVEGVWSIWNPNQANWEMVLEWNGMWDRKGIWIML
jgi:hypothetical protein